MEHTGTTQAIHFEYQEPYEDLFRRSLGRAAGAQKNGVREDERRSRGVHGAVTRFQQFPLATAE
jgi:hypothetical protein